ncbi:MAG: DEAD/DEAH box helicase [Deltaproteobacteria bacterium]|nr:DEAD/DEAH box helicase [Deltaproteobacteria bacterium]
MTSFADLGLCQPLLRAVEAEGYQTPTPIQARAIPFLLQGRDLLGVAQTGTGKTAAFTLPMLQLLAESDVRPAPRTPRALILTPTRELAIQIDESLATYGKHLRIQHAVIFGGVGQRPQVQALTRGVHVLVATPGRLLDLMGQGHIKLGQVEIFVLDEADRMLDMGFVRDVRTVVAALPARRQTLLFSATMPEAITGLAGSVLRNPERVEVTPAATPVERIEQRVLFVDKGDKRHVLSDLFTDRAVGRAIVFTRTKHGANRVAEWLEKGGVSCGALHGNKSQGARQRALAAFSAGSVRALVATDIAARGLDVDDVTHVINYDLPNEPESYVHRIGRTGRAGSDGIAISLCDAEQVGFLRDIERTIRRKVEVDVDHKWHDAGIAAMVSSAPQRSGGGGGGGRSGGGGGGGRSRGRSGGGRSGHACSDGGPRVEVRGGSGGNGSARARTGRAAPRAGGVPWERARSALTRARVGRLKVPEAPRRPRGAAPPPARRPAPVRPSPGARRCSTAPHRGRSAAAAGRAGAAAGRASSSRACR